MTTTLKGMVSAFLSTRRLRNLSPNTITFYSQRLNKFLEFMESHYPDVSLEQIDHSILREIVLGLKKNHSAGGVNHFDFHLNHILLSGKLVFGISSFRRL